MNLSTTGLSLAADSAVDLHLHTTYSDGHWTLEPLLDYLLREQFGLVAIADHDRADNVAVILSANRFCENQATAGACQTEGSNSKFSVRSVVSSFLYSSRLAKK